MPSSQSIAAFRRVSIERGETAEVFVAAGPRPPEAVRLVATVNRFDGVAGGLQAQASADLAPDGSAIVQFVTADWFRDALFAVIELSYLGVSGEVLASMCPLGDGGWLHLREPGEEALDSEGIQGRLQELKARHQELYGAALGTPGEGKTRWQGVVVVERLLLHTGLLLPGAEAQPTGQGNPATSEAEILNTVMTSLDPRLKKAVTLSEWTKRNEQARPVSVLLFPTVHAIDLADADRLVRARADELLGLLALKRRAAPRAIGTVLTAPEQGAVKIQIGSPPYRGNLLGGELAGESQLVFTQHDAAARQDPVLALALSLIRDAHAEEREDFAFFRYWSILELLANRRVKPRLPVVLLSGEPLKNREGKQRTTKDAAPRVYVLLADWLGKRKVDEASFVDPAANLWEAVQVWYKRRNATAHEGGFNPSSLEKSGVSEALRASKGTSETANKWRWTLREACTMLIEWELSDVPEI